LSTERRTAATVGVLYIIGSVAGILSVSVTGGGLEGPDYLASADSIGARLPAGALLILVMGLALAFIPIVIFPILRETSERMALGYIVFRSALETCGYFLVVVMWTVLFLLADSDTNLDELRGVGTALGDIAEMGGTIGTIFFLTGAGLFYWVLFTSRLVPRWLSGWGLVAAVPYLIAALLKIFAAIEPFSTTEVLLSAPLGLQEMVLALWLIVRGFSRQ
jgi:hypothetical protein